MALNVRKLAALELHLLGPVLVLTEYVIGVAAPLVLGALTLRDALRHNRPLGLTAFGIYLFTLGVNYLPLLLHATQLARSRHWSAVTADEVVHPSSSLRGYRLQSLLLLLPLVIPALALMQFGEGAENRR